jgi:hypothetical protein
MSDLEIRHKGEEQLLRYADGELPAREAAEVRQHLEACWQCRAALAELEDLVGRCMRYRRDVLQVALPPPPLPWTDIRRKFDEVELSSARVSWLGRLGNFRLPGRWIPVAVTAALLCGVYLRFRETPSVHAAELLKRAVAAAERGPQAPRRIQIRTSRHRITRIQGAHQPAAHPETTKQMRSLFELANYSWEDPLSARSFQSWRERLDQKQDEVIAVNGGRRIRTTTDSGELVEATLTLKGQDLQPVEGTLRFRNSEFVEITEVPAPPMPAPPLAASVEAAPSAAPSEPAVEPAPPAATIADELQVIARLHRLGADLGEPVEVRRESGMVMVTGIGIGAARQRQIESELHALPNVVVRFSQPPSIPEQAPAGPEPVPAAAPYPTAKLEKALGERAGELLDVSDALMARVYAVRRLAQRFPEWEESQLGGEERRTLARLLQEHSSALRARATEIHDLLSPVLRPDTGAAAPARPPALPSGWQPAAEELFGRARLLERLLVAALGGSAMESPAEELPGRLSAAVAELRVVTEAYDHMVSKN